MWAEQAVSGAASGAGKTVIVSVVKTDLLDVEQLLERGGRVEGEWRGAPACGAPSLHLSLMSAPASPGTCQNTTFGPDPESPNLAPRGGAQPCVKEPSGRPDAPSSLRATGLSHSAKNLVTLFHFLCVCLPLQAGDPEVRNCVCVYVSLALGPGLSTG